MTRDEFFAICPSAEWPDEMSDSNFEAALRDIDRILAFKAEYATGSTLSRSSEIQQQFYYLKALEMGPLATEDEIREVVEMALKLFTIWWRRK